MLDDFINTTRLQSEVGQIIKPLHYVGIVSDVELPDPSNYKHGDVIVHQKGIYVNERINDIFCWIRLDSPGATHILNIDEPTPDGGEYMWIENKWVPVWVPVNETHQKENDPTPWLALLE